MFEKAIQPAVLFMNKLPFKIKIIASVSILFLLLIMPSKTTFLNYIEKSNIYNSQLIGITYIEKIQNIIQNIQLHRGMTNGYLSGNNSFKSKIKSKEIEIDEKLLELVAFDKNNLAMLNHDKDFVDALSSYITVKLENDSKSRMMSSDEIFSLHNKTINSLIKTIQQISKLTSFSTSSNLKVNYIAHLLEEKLLLLQENTGQLRGITVGILSQKNLTKEKKSKVLSHYTVIKALENSILENNLLAEMDNFLSIQKDVSLTAYKINSMLDIINKNIVLENNFSYDSKHFFSIATDAIDAQTKLYKQFSNTYKNLIKDMKSSALVDFTLLVTGLIFILLSSLYIFVAFYHSVANSLKKLQIASKMIAEGKMSIHIEADSKDEIGDAILSFNDMSQKLDKSISFLDGYKMAIDETSIVSKTNAKGIITYANKMFCEISGYREGELIGRPQNIVRHPDIPKEVFKQMWQTIQNKQIWKGVVKNRAKDGSDYIVDATIIPVLDHNNEVIEYIGIRHDITELEKSKDEIKKQRVDMLTGLHNGNKLINDLKDSKKPILFYLNIDSFSDINDFYGMKIGDDVLVHLSQLLKDMYDQYDCKIYKYHNDEFFILFEESILDINECEELIQNTIEFIEKETIECDEDSCISITLSGGFTHHKHSDNYEKLISLAMIAHKEAKTENKKYLHFDDDMNKESDYKKNIEWINKIKNALEKDKIKPFFQPLIDNKTGAITKFEALVRLIDDSGKVVSPFFFLDISKKARLYTKITKIVIDKTLTQLEKTPQYDFSINLTVEDIKDKDICSYIIERLKNTKYSDHIIFEITESEKIADYGLVNSFIQLVREYGVKIAIDDFGSGYANFDHIISLKADFIKIDGSLIKVIDTNKEAEIITEAIIAFSKKLGSKTVVEYVHSKEVYEKVISLGADYSQGFYLGEPMEDISSIRDLITKEHKDSVIV